MWSTFPVNKNRLTRSVLCDYSLPLPRFSKPFSSRLCGVGPCNYGRRDRTAASRRQVGGKEARTAKPVPPKPAAPERSEALTLLAALQREARFVDFIKEPLDAYSDAQVGAASRDVHRECGRVIERMFAVEANSDLEEGAKIEVPQGTDPGCIRLVGNVTDGADVLWRNRSSGVEGDSM